MATTVIALLDREWAQLGESAVGAQALRRWAGEDPALAGFTTLSQLAAATTRMAPAFSEEVLAVLARLAPGDALAARTLLQLVLPGCKALVRRFAGAGEADEVASVVVACVYGRIATYPSQRRRRWIAADLVGHAKRTLLRRATERTAAVVEDLSEVLVAPEAVPSALEELGEILRWAVGEGHLSAEDARLIARTRSGAATVAQVCAERGASAKAVWERRRRAEQRLRAVVTAA